MESSGLKELLLSKVDGLQQEIDRRFADAKEAIAKAEMNADKRFSSVNEFRQTLSDQQATLARKSEVELRFKSLDDKVDLLLTAQSRYAGRDNGIAISWSVVIALTSVAAVFWISL